MNTLISTLKQLANKGQVRQLDYQFARFIESQSQDSQLAFIAGVVSNELAKGHICLPLLDAQGQPVDLAAKLGLFGEAASELNQHLLSIDWLALLSSSDLVGCKGEPVPLIFDGERLYLHRYWHYEVVVAERLTSFGSPMILKLDQQQKLAQLLDHLFARNYRYLFEDVGKSISDGVSTAVLRQRMVCDHLDVVAEDNLDWPTIDQTLLKAKNIEQLAPLDEQVPLAACINWQKVAAAVALSRRFAVISGGPGTGKTTTVTKLLAALIEQAQANDQQPAIKLVAPTGKAAARLTESIGKAVSALPVSPELKQIGRAHV